MGGVVDAMTKPIRYVLNKPKEYFVYDMAGKFVPVKGTPIKVPGLEGEDLFWHQDLSGFGGRISEGLTGTTFGGHYNSKKRAIAEAEIKHGKLKVGFDIIKKMALRNLKRLGSGPSPRYRKEGGK